MLELKFMQKKSYKKFQLNLSKHIGEKWETMITSILSSNRGTTPTEINGNWMHFYLI